MKSKKFEIILGILMLIPFTVRAQFVSPEAEMGARGESMMFASEEEAQEPAMPAPPANYRFDTSHSIALIVNGEMVTNEDINDRIRAFSFISEIPLNAETGPMIKKRVIQNTIDEKLKLQEAKKENIVISEKEIDEAVDNFARSNKIKPADLKKMLKSANVNVNTFREQMRSDLAWIRLAHRKTSGEIEPSQKEINRELEAIKREANRERYKISEIVIKKKTAGNLDDLVYNLRNDPRFSLYAMQFSEAPTAARGGSLDWVAKEKLYPQLQNAVVKMKKGDISSPILIGDEYYIIKLEDKYIPGQSKKIEPTEQEIKEMIEGKRLEDFASGYLNKIRQRSIIDIKAK